VAKPELLAKKQAQPPPSRRHETGPDQRHEPVESAGTTIELTPANLRFLQRVAGNAAVADLLAAAENRKPAAPPDAAPAAEAAQPAVGAVDAALGNALGPPIAAPPGSAATPALTKPAAPNGKGATGEKPADAKAAPPEGAGVAIAPGPTSEPKVPATAPAADTAETAPSAGTARTPETDPNFIALRGRVQDKARQTRAHPPAGAKVAEAQAAAHGPTNEVASQAGAAQVDTMAGQQPGAFDKQAFMDAVRKAVDNAAPRSLAEADDFKGSGKAEQVKHQVSGMVGQNKDAAERDIKGATQAPADASVAKPKPVTEMPAEAPGDAPTGVGAAGAMPTPKTAEETSLAKGPAEVDASMKAADVTDEQLKESNEPEFQGALEAKGAAQKHSAEAPKQFQQEEKGVLEKGRASATGTAAQGLSGMHAERAKGLAAVASGKGEAKTKDEARRAEVSNNIEAIYAKTKDDVTGILNGIDGQVDKAFSEGEEKARAAFESYVDVRMKAYKDDRYSGWTGGLKWAKDKLFGMPNDVNEFYVKGRDLYLQRMDGVIGHIADIVGGELTRAKNRIAQGQSEIKRYVAGLPADLKKVGLEAQESIQSKFDELGQSVDAKQEELVNSLAQKYVESRDKVDERITEMKAANKGLVDKAIDAVKGVIETIRKLKDMLLNVLAKAAGVVGTIIGHPIRFLANLVDGIGQGLKQFMANIGEHLKKGLLGWLFGALGEAGLQLPEKFDLKGILSIIMQVLGLTYSHVRGLAVGIVGEEVVARLEKSVEFFKVLIVEGPAGLWKWVVNKLSELKQTVLDQIKAFIQEKVIIAGIMWLIGLLNPVAAFIKACKAIYDIVMFFIERAAQVGELINAILDSVGAIAGGALGQAAGFIENALAKAIPVAIGFLASLLGLGGISEKIRSIIHAIQEPIHKMISKVLNVVLKPFKWIGNKIKQGAAWAKKKVTQGVAFVKGKAQAGIAAIKSKLPGQKAKPADPEHDKKVAAGLKQIDREEVKYVVGGAVARHDAELVAATVKADNPIFKSVKVVAGDGHWDYAYEASKGIKTGPLQSTVTSKYVNAQGEIIQGPPDHYEDIREWFYKKGFRKKYKDQILAAAKDGVDGNGEQLYYCQNPDGSSVANHKEKLLISEVTLDHVRAVAWHWNRYGRNTNQAMRYEWYDSCALVVYCRACNSSKGSGGIEYTMKVGPNFKGWKE
jgi:hypothetical protein